LREAFCECSCSYSFLIHSSSALTEEFSHLKASARYPSSLHSTWNNRIRSRKALNKILLELRSWNSGSRMSA
jgi:hypothetical protein